MAEFDLGAYDRALKEKQASCKHEHVIDGFGLYTGGDKVCQNCLKNFTYYEYAEMKNSMNAETVQIYSTVR